MTTTPLSVDPVRLLGLLRRQRDLYLALRTLSEKQRNLISGDRPELLLTILRDRQGLVTELAKLNEEMGPYRRSWDAAYAALPTDARAEAAGLLQEINGLLRVILHADQEDTALLSAKRSAVAQELSDVRGGQTAASAYGRPQTPPRTGAADITG